MQIHSIDVRTAIEMHPTADGWSLQPIGDAPQPPPFSCLRDAMAEARSRARAHRAAVHVHDFHGRLVDMRVHYQRTASEDYYVVPNARDWLVKRRGHAGYSRFDTKAQALDRARLMARHTGDRVHLYYKNGQLQRTLDYR